MDRGRLFGEGTVLDGHYEIGPLLGQGGMAQVYLAFDRWLQRKVAIKAAPQALRDYLAREAQTLAGFQVPGLVAAHSFGYHEGTPYVVLEYLDGVSLGDRLTGEDGPLPSIDEALRLTAGICEAVRPLHERGIVHCDLKPGNIMCTGTRVVLIDFGLVWDPPRDGPRQGSLGSPPFMAPEAITRVVAPGQEHLIDVYAIGMILYALIAGIPAFDGGDLVALMERQLVERPCPLSTLREGLPPRLSEVAASLIERDPSNRPQSVAEVRDAIVGIPRRSRGTGERA